MTKVYCSETATTAVYDCMRLVGIASYTKNLAPLERIMRDAMAFPLYDGGNLGMRGGSCTRCSASRVMTQCWPLMARCHPGRSDRSAPAAPAT